MAANWIGSVIASGSSGAFSFGTAYHNRKFAEKQSNIAHQRDLEQWSRQNAYNDPAQQMQRLKAAGLNPNLVYGTGASGASGMAKSSVPGYTPAKGEMPTNAFSGVGILNLYNDLRIKKVTADRIKEEVEYIRQKRINESLRTNILGYDVYQKGELSPYFIEMRKDEQRKTALQVQQEGVKLELLDRNLTKEEVLIEKMKAEKLKIEFGNQLREFGVVETDPAWWRLIVRVMTETGLPFWEVVKEVSGVPIE